MQFYPFARRLLALALTAAFMTTAALSGFAVYAMPIQAAYPQESIYLFDADTGEDLLDAVHRADAALYQGKQQGRNQVVLSQAPTGQDARPERARSPAMRQD